MSRPRQLFFINFDDRGDLRDPDPDVIHGEREGAFYSSCNRILHENMQARDRKSYLFCQCYNVQLLSALVAGNGPGGVWLE